MTLLRSILFNLWFFGWTPLVGLAWRQQGYGMDKSIQGFVNLPGALSNSSGNMLEETYFG